MMHGLLEGMSRWAKEDAGKTDFKYNGKTGI